MLQGASFTIGQLATASVAIAAIGFVDYMTGLEIRIFPLYFAPVAYMSAARGASAGIATSAICALTWLLSNLAAGTQRPAWLLAANTGLQLCACAFVAILIARMRALLHSEHAQARNDALTGLPNRRALIERATIEYARLRRGSAPLIVACVDLDGFKQVNDQAGHAAGDRLLRRAGRVIQESLREPDMAARIGGDEFILLLPETDRRAAIGVLERVRATLSRDLGGAEWPPVTASIGAAVVFPPGIEDLDAALRLADEALYRAKQTGRDRVHVSDAGNAE